MAKTVGLSRKITLQWLNKAVELREANLTEEEYKTKMNEYLSFEIGSPTNLRKTREILMRLWFYEDDQIVTQIRNEALPLIKKHPDYAMPIHWCLMLASYPVFADLSRLMSKIAEFNDVIILSQLKQKLFDEWGERSTLYHSTDKIIQTIKELGVITATKPGKYTIIKHTVSNSEIVEFMLHVALRVDGNSYYSFSELNDFAVLYPFDYQVSREIVTSDEMIVCSNLGGELSVALKEM